MYPPTLTTSEWVDYLQGQDRDTQIATLATYHRRIAYAAQVATLEGLIDPDPDAGDAVTRAAKQALDRLLAPPDYQPS